MEYLSRGRKLVVLASKRRTSNEAFTDRSNVTKLPASEVNETDPNTKLQSETRCYFLSNRVSLTDFNTLSKFYHLEANRVVKEILDSIIGIVFQTVNDFFNINIEDLIVLDENLVPILNDSNAIIEWDSPIFDNEQLHLENNIIDGVNGNDSVQYENATNERSNASKITDSPDESNKENVYYLKKDEVFKIDTSATKTGEERKRKKFVRSKTERKKYLRDEKIEKHAVRREGCKCKKNCNDKFSKEAREKINKKYWNMNFAEKKMFLSSNIEDYDVKVRRSDTLHDTPVRNKTRVFSFKSKDGNRIKVCKTFFLGTLGYASNSDTIIRKFYSPPIDRRGSYLRKGTNKNVIADHIKSFHPAVSHYRREHAPKRLYLPSDITIKDMHSDFLQKFPAETVSYEIYRRIVTDEMNISFVQLGKEECEKCETYTLHKQVHTVLDTICEVCCQWKKHIDDAKRSRDEYRKDVSLAETSQTEIVYFSVDMQKIIMLPRLDMFKQIIFTQRLIVFNESFVPLGKLAKNSVQPFAALWHEAISGRKKEDIVSAFNAFFKNHVRDHKQIVFWADNCCGQNKNWCFFSFLIYLVNSGEIAADKITIKYFEVGHTFMSADSFHHLIEQGLRKHKKCYDFQDFCDVVKNCSKYPVSIKELSTSDFMKWPTFTTNYQLQKMNKDRPLLKEISEISVKKGSYVLYHKTCFDGPENELVLLSKKWQGTKPLPEPEGNSLARGITEKKKQGIIQSLKGLCPPHKLKFWEKLDVNDNAVDLINEVDD